MMNNKWKLFQKQNELVTLEIFTFIYIKNESEKVDD